MKSKYSKIMRELEKQSNSQHDTNIVIVDGTNTFMRSFIKVQKLNYSGHHVGGLIGFLKSICYLVKRFVPTKVIIVFDGANSSNSRKNINPQYKANRNVQKVRKGNFFNSKEDEDISIEEQMVRLTQYLRCLPLFQLAVDGCEADDIIAYLSKGFGNQDRNVTIVSSDQDFLQLVNDNIKVYRPMERKLYGTSEVVEKFGVYPTNYLLYKSLLGDTSDNIKGIKGCGKKTILKRFPNMTESKEVTVDSFLDYCEDNMEGYKIYSDVLSLEHRLHENIEIMSLHRDSLSKAQKQEVFDTLIGDEEESLRIAKVPFIQLSSMDGIQDYISQNIHSWVGSFEYLTAFRKNKK